MKMSIHPSVGPVKRVRLLTYRRGQSGPYQHTNADLIFVDGVPTVVIEWDVRPGGDLPLVTAPLDPQHLQDLGWADADFLYDGAIEIP
jgi:hypothetical protein